MQPVCLGALVRASADLAAASPAQLEITDQAPSIAAGGAIRATTFLDETSDPADWATQLTYVAPWGEIGSRFVAISSPLSALKLVKDPTAVAAYWTKVRRAEDYLAGWPAEPVYPMRYSPDIDISAGYMHSG